MMVWVGFVAIAVSVIWILIKLYMAYHSAGGTNMVVVYDAAVYPPVLATIGLYFVLPAYKYDLAIWIYLIIWAIVCVATVGAIRLMERIGDRPL